MRCGRCAGLVIENHDETFCLNCGHRPHQVLRIGKCAWAVCLRDAEADGYCPMHQRIRASLRANSMRSGCAASRQRNANGCKDSRICGRASVPPPTVAIGP